MMKQNFLERYKESFGSIHGYFAYDVAVLFMTYNQLVAAQDVTGGVLEIGVRHGLSAIVIAALCGEDRRFFAVDLFEDLQLTVPGVATFTVFVFNA